MNEYQLHPLCTLFPRMTGQEFQSLVDDIKANGLRDPIIIHDDMILDGGNRYQACLAAGVEPTLMKFGGENIVSYVLSVNLHRRHLSAGQQAAIVASAQDWAKAQPAYRPEKPGNVTGLSTVADRAAKSGASDKTQRMADKVAKTDPELAKKVAHGEISLPKAVEKLSPKSKKESRNFESVNDHYEEVGLSQKDFELIEIKEANLILLEENIRLKDAISVNQLPSEIEIENASVIIDDLRNHVKALEAELSAIKSVRNGLIIENSELKKQSIWQLEKLKKAGLLK